MVEICALASGSNGNCYYIGNEEHAILIDAGIFYNMMLNRLESVGLSVDKIRAAFISHEHNDHVRGAYSVCNKLQIPVFYSRNTFNNTYKTFRARHAPFFESDVEQNVFGIKVLPFRKRHDAADPHSFVVEINGLHIGVMTDIGIADERVIAEFNKCDAVFLESNYDEQMLWNGSYPYFLKQRVSSEVGHLSNKQAFELVEKYASPSLSHIFLSHISAENNTIEKALSTFGNLTKKIQILPTSREAASVVVRLN